VVEKRLLDIDQTANYLSISPKTIRNGLGPRAKKPFPVKPKRFGRKVLFDIEDLKQFVKELSEQDILFGYCRLFSLSMDFATDFAVLF